MRKMLRYEGFNNKITENTEGVFLSLKPKRRVRLSAAVYFSDFF